MDPNVIFFIIGALVATGYLLLVAGISFLIPTVKQLSKFKVVDRFKLTKDERLEYSKQIFNIGYVSFFIFSAISHFIRAEILYVDWRFNANDEGVEYYILLLFVFLIASATALQLYAIDLRRNRYNVVTHLGIALAIGGLATFLASTTANYIG